mmetsp:Transcript_26322/g.83344  ORF Transcript_26322/g.83344 Transcript_26322/m.83344 type:complete len:536 (-) Transcript_26322:228-1835(-)
MGRSPLDCGTASGLRTSFGGLRKRVSEPIHHMRNCLVRLTWELRKLHDTGLPGLDLEMPRDPLLGKVLRQGGIAGLRRLKDCPLQVALDWRTLHTPLLVLELRLHQIVLVKLLPELARRGPSHDDGDVLHTPSIEKITVQLIRDHSHIVREVRDSIRGDLPISHRGSPAFDRDVPDEGCAPAAGGRVRKVALAARCQLSVKCGEDLVGKGMVVFLCNARVLRPKLHQVVPKLLGVPRLAVCCTGGLLEDVREGRGPHEFGGHVQRDDVEADGRIPLGQERRQRLGPGPSIELGQWSNVAPAPEAHVPVAFVYWHEVNPLDLLLRQLFRLHETPAHPNRAVDVLRKDVFLGCNDVGQWPQDEKVAILRSALPLEALLEEGRRVAVFVPAWEAQFRIKAHELAQTAHAILTVDVLGASASAGGLVFALGVVVKLRHVTRLALGHSRGREREVRHIKQSQEPWEGVVADPSGDVAIGDPNADDADVPLAVLPKRGRKGNVVVDANVSVNVDLLASFCPGLRRQAQRGARPCGPAQRRR